MTSYNSQVWYGGKSFKIQYETDDEEKYKYIEEQIRKQIDKENIKNISNCCTDIETLLALNERAEKDLKNNTHKIEQHEILTIIREFIRLKNDYKILKENKE